MLSIIQAPPVLPAPIEVVTVMNLSQSPMNSMGDALVEVVILGSCLLLEQDLVANSEGDLQHKNVNRRPFPIPQFTKKQLMSDLSRRVVTPKR